MSFHVSETLHHKTVNMGMIFDLSLDFSKDTLIKIDFSVIFIWMQ